MTSKGGNRVQRFICWLKGHEWSERPAIRRTKLDDVVGECSRCGETATRIQAATIKSEGSGPPFSLLDQPPEMEIQAMYAEGLIDEEQLETLMEKQMEAEHDC